MGAGHPARSLLFDLLRQHNGRNNGHIQIATSWMGKRGWTSNDVLHRAKLELIERELIIQTRQGGLNAGPNQYALTWLPISNFVGLDIESKNYHPGRWHFMDKPPIIGSRSNTASRNSENHSMSSVSRCSTVPSDGMVEQLTAPPHGAKTALSGTSTAPSDGNNEYNHTYPHTSTGKIRRPVVGAKGRSGKKSVIAREGVN
jgi:hypothetical protein